MTNLGELQNLVWVNVLLLQSQNPERDFTIRISGLEIYNENVRDLLNSESGRNLKLLDDPEVYLPIHNLISNFWSGLFLLLHMLTCTHRVPRMWQKGTVVEKLVEERANNDQHLRHLISICEGKYVRSLDRKVELEHYLQCSKLLIDFL